MTWLKSSIFFLCLLVASSVSAQAMDTTEELSIAVGENRTIPANDVKNYSEGAPGIVEIKVTPGGNQFVIVGVKPGSTTLLLLMKDGRQVVWKLNVFPQPIQIVESELSKLLGDTPGVRVSRVGARFFVEGGVTTEPELERIAHIASLYPGQVESLVVLGGVAAERKINLRVDLFFVQYSKSRSLQIGVNWPAAVGGGVANFAFSFLTRTAITAQASLVNQALPGLDLAQRNGWAKVMKHATVITANGSEAEFANGGAQFFATTAGLTSTLREINFGTTMKILPRYDPRTHELQVKVGADVADLTPPLTPEAELPGQVTSKLATSVALKLGQALVLSGISTTASRNTKAGLPWLSQIPILGALFGSESIQSEDVEGAVFIVPSVIESVSRRSSDIVESALAEYEDFSGDLSDVRPLPAAAELGRGANR